MRKTDGMQHPCSKQACRRDSAGKAKRCGPQQRYHGGGKSAEDEAADLRHARLSTFGRQQRRATEEAKKRSERGTTGRTTGGGRRRAEERTVDLGGRVGGVSIFVFGV